MVRLLNDRSYYIPGNAIIYGLFEDLDGTAANKNIRVFGHGTINGSKARHWQDYGGLDLRCRILQLINAVDCNYEGITLADPPEFGPRFENFEGRENTPRNSMKWIKSITWRVNTDGTSGGHADLEDCFFATRMMAFTSVEQTSVAAFSGPTSTERLFTPNSRPLTMSRRRSAWIRGTRSSKTAT